MHRQRFLQQDSVQPLPIAYFAQRPCPLATTTHFAAADSRCRGFHAAVGDVTLSPGLRGVISSRGGLLRSAAPSVVDYLTTATSAEECCDACTANPSCIAQQFLMGRCLHVFHALLDSPEVFQVDVPGWAAAASGEGIFYYRKSNQCILYYVTASFSAKMDSLDVSDFTSPNLNFDDTSDFDSSMLGSIGRVVATASGVNADMVSIDRDPECWLYLVCLVARITFNDETTAVATAAALSGMPSPSTLNVDPIFASEMVLTQALGSAGAPVVVFTILTAPTAHSVAASGAQCVAASDAQCDAFLSRSITGVDLLHSLGSQYLGDDEATLVFEGVYTEAGCCTLASRYACSVNPVRIWQLLGSSRCVMHRSRFLERIGIGLAGSFVQTLSLLSTSGPIGNVHFTENPQCQSGNGEVAPCREDVAGPTCTINPYETCFYDVTCKRGGLGCNAAGYEACRFCGFGDYLSVTCPGSLASTQVDVVVDVASACPRACTSNSTQTCFRDASCSNSLSATYYNGLGCNAGNIGKDCRFCGFDATRETLQCERNMEGVDSLAAYPKYVDCPEPAESFQRVHFESAAALQSHSKLGATMSHVTMTSLTSGLLEVLQTSATTDTVSAAASLQESVCKSDASCTVRIVETSDYAIPATMEITGRRRMHPRLEGGQLGEPLGRMRGRLMQASQLRANTISVIQFEVEQDAMTTDPAVDATLNNPDEIIAAMLSDEGTLDVVRSALTFATRVAISAETAAQPSQNRRGLQSSSAIENMRTAVAAAITEALSVQVDDVLVSTLTATLLPPSFFIAPRTPSPPSSRPPPDAVSQVVVSVRRSAGMSGLAVGMLLSGVGLCVVACITLTISSSRSSRAKRTRTAKMVEGVTLNLPATPTSTSSTSRVIETSKV